MNRDMELFDVVIVGAGMAGMSAATYAAADGMRVALMETVRPGGQAWHSPKIDNVVGMPGISGILLSSRSLQQCLDLGVKFVEAAPRKVEVEAPEVQGAEIWVTTTQGFTLDTRTLVIATGKSFNKLSIPGMAKLEGKQVFYGEAAVRGPRLLKGKPVAVIGGGNASAQSVLDLDLFCSKVHVIIRGEPTWSDYLHQQIIRRRDVVLWRHSVVDSLGDDIDGAMTAIKVRTPTGYEVIDANGLFILAGQSPNLSVAKMCNLQTTPVWGEERIATGGKQHTWSDQIIRSYKDRLYRDKFSLETSMPGVFAIGDVRDGMGHGIAAAMGDGNRVVGSIWEYLQYDHPARFQALLQRPPLPQPHP